MYEKYLADFLMNPVSALNIELHLSVLNAIRA